MTAVMLWAAAAMLVVAAVLTLWRVTVGPSTLDRIVSADVLISIVLIAIALSTVLFGNSSALPILLVLSMVAFTGGVSVARMLAPHAPDRQRYLREDGEP